MMMCDSPLVQRLAEQIHAFCIACIHEKSGEDESDWRYDEERRTRWEGGRCVLLKSVQFGCHLSQRVDR